MNQVDLAALTLVLLFGYRGYRAGFIGVALGLTGGLLAFGLAAVLAPLLAPAVTPFVTERLHAPSVLLRPVLIIGLTVVLRFLFGFAVRELIAALGLVIRAVPPLALVDRVLGILPSALLGALLACALVAVALYLPLGERERTAVEQSWIARTVVERPEEALRRVRDLGGRLLTDPPRLNGYALGAGVAGLTVAAFAATRLRGTMAPFALEEAPTRRAPHRSARASAGAGIADPFAWVRFTFGLGVALAMAAALVFVAGAR